MESFIEQSTKPPITKFSRKPWRLVLVGGFVGFCVSQPGPSRANPAAGAALLQQRLDAPAGDERFGEAVALSGDTAVFGVKYGFPSRKLHAGSAYIYVRSGNVWSLQQRIDGAKEDDYFGHAVAISGGTAVISAYWEFHEKKDKARSAYIYVRNGNTWHLEQQIDGSATGDALGYSSVAVAGDTVVLGSHLASPGGKSEAGSVFIYGRSGKNWRLQQRIDGREGEQLGRSVATSGDTVAFGAEYASPGKIESAGSVYLYGRSGQSWSLQQQIDGRGLQEKIGTGISISNDTLAIGAYVANPNGKMQAGSVYLYVRSGKTWSLQQQFDGREEGKYFGHAVAVAGDTLVISRKESEASPMKPTSTSIYRRSGTKWSLLQEIDGLSDELQEAISGDTFILSSDHACAKPPKCGTAFIYSLGRDGNPSAH